MEGLPEEGKVADMEQEARLLEAFASIASIDRAWCFPKSQGMDVMVSLSQRNLPANSMRKSLGHCYITDSLTGSPPSAHWAPFFTEYRGVTMSVPSPSGSRLLVIRSGEKAGEGGVTGSTPSATKIEIWSHSRLLREFFIPASTHGAVYADGWFEGVDWSPDEALVAYVAEEPSAKRPKFGGTNGVSLSAQTGCTETEKSDTGTWQGQGGMREDWGERYTGKGRPVLFMLEVSSGKVHRVNGIPNDVSAGQVVWAPSGPVPQLVFVGWPSFASNFNTPTRLGMVYCYNRPCALYAVPAPSLDGGDRSKPAGAAPAAVTAEKLSGSLTSAFLPRFTPDGAHLLFVSAHAAVDSGTHNATNSLHKIPWLAAKGPQAFARNTEPAVVLDVKPRPDSDSPGAFPGLYCSSLPANPWLPDGRSLVATSTWRSTEAIIAINAESGDVRKISPDGAESWSALAVKGGYIIAACSSPISPAKLKLGRRSGGGGGEGAQWEWTDVSPPSEEYAAEVEDALRSLEYEVLQIQAPQVAGVEELTQGGRAPFEAIIVRTTRQKAAPEPEAAPPLLLMPHGGPHGAYTTSFMLSVAYLCTQGFNALLVNFRGSTGFGEEALQALPGNAGRLDVADNLAALDEALRLGYGDAARVAVVGGSHGGFLAAHLIGQAPDKFRTAVLRNPVCSIASMVGVTDIPDWGFVETFGSRHGPPLYTDNPGPEALAAFLAASPIAHVDKVKVPVLLVLGAQDRRVPVSSGLQYARALRARGLEARVIMFPEDNHAIDRPQSEFEQWVNVASWLKQHLLRLEPASTKQQTA